MSGREDAEKLLTWLREPDYAEDFSLSHATDWINRRPIAEAMRLLAISQITTGIMILPIASSSALPDDR